MLIFDGKREAVAAADEWAARTGDPWVVRSILRMGGYIGYWAVNASVPVHLPEVYRTGT